MVATPPYEMELRNDVVGFRRQVPTPFTPVELAERLIVTLAELAVSHPDSAIRCTVYLYSADRIMMHLTAVPGREAEALAEMRAAKKWEAEQLAQAKGVTV